jgi:hypothetical protein
MWSSITNFARLATGVRPSRRVLAQRQGVIGQGWHDVAVPPVRGRFAPLAAWPVEVPAPLRGVLVARSPRSKLFCWSERDGYRVWLSWHHWYKHGGHEGGGGPVDLTRYFVELPGPYPHTFVRRRTWLAARLWARSGAGTGDAAFDRAYAVRPGKAAALMTPGIREAMLTGRYPPWSLEWHMLVVRYREPPVNVTARADDAIRLAQMLLSPSPVEPAPPWPGRRRPATASATTA